jgi:ATP-dependent Lon protease
VELKEQHFRITYGATGFSYDSIFGKYLTGVKEVIVEDPYIRSTHQIQNLVRFCETVIRRASVKTIHLITTTDNATQKAEAVNAFSDLAQSLLDLGVKFTWEFRDTLHDRQISFSNGWIVKIGRGLDFYQKPDSWFTVGAHDMDLRPCMETMVDIYRVTP